MSFEELKFDHEDFFINNKNSQNQKTVRAKRFSVNASENFALKIDDHLYPIINYSSSGVAIIGDTNIDHGKIIKNATILLNDTSIEVVDLVFVRTESLADQRYLCAFKTLNSVIDTATIQTMRETLGITLIHSKKIEEITKIPEEIRLKTLEFYEFLTSLKTEVDTIERNLPLDNRQDREKKERAVCQIISSYLNQVFEREYLSFEKKLNILDSKVKKISVDYFRDKLKDFLYLSPFAHRSFYKPLGYAGDYEMMNLIYRNELVGENLFAKCMHQFYIEKPAAQAVRNRRQYLHKKIKESFGLSNKPKILSVASGPAYEVETFLTENPEISADFYLLDQDLNALQYAKEQIYQTKMMSNFNSNVEFINLAIKNVINDGLGENKFDLIYSAGLFDYFTDSVAQNAGKQC